jgi:thioredoxin-like negative regulator of GroEL
VASSESEPEPLPTVEVRLAPALVPESAPFREETAGLLTVLVEMGLADLQGVVPLVEGAAASPGLADPVESLGKTWIGALTAFGTDPLQLNLELCAAPETCTVLRGEGPAAEPWVAVSQVLDGAAQTLARPASLPGAPDEWRRPVSKDPYAVLLAGRAAAVLYGVLPAPAEEDLGDRRKDPVVRAVYVDPHSAPAAWVLVRRDAERGQYAAAQDAFERALESRPSSLALLADQAAISAMASKPATALDAWLAMSARTPRDLRFRLPLARAHLRNQQTNDASAVLDHLPGWAQDERAVVEMRVAIADAAGDIVAGDALLARWQAAAPDDPEPIRRRIALRVSERQYAAALDLIDELAATGAGEEASRLEMTLSLGVGDLERADRAARALGLDDVARRIEVRRTVGGADPGSTLAAIGASRDRWERLTRAQALLDSGEAAKALADIGPVLDEAPYQPEALALQIACLDALGRPAVVPRARLRWADPDAAR